MNQSFRRLSGRIIHRQTGETFHKVFNPPVDYKEEDYYQREDDKPETVKRRLDVNIAQGEPILAHYRAKLVHEIEIKTSTASSRYPRSWRI